MEFESKDLGKPPQDQHSSPLFTESSVSASSPGYCFLLLLLTVTNTVGSTHCSVLGFTDNWAGSHFPDPPSRLSTLFDFLRLPGEYYYCLYKEKEDMVNNVTHVVGDKTGMRRLMGRPGREEAACSCAAALGVCWENQKIIAELQNMRFYSQKP